MKSKGSNRQTKPATVATVKGSERHLSKTHGSHNGRVHTFPHIADKLDRPQPLPDLSPSVVRDRKPGRKHARVYRPMTRINQFNYQDPAKDIRPSVTIYLVTAKLYHNLTPVSVKVGAKSPENAKALALELLTRSYLTWVIDLEARPA